MTQSKPPGSPRQAKPRGAKVHGIGLVPGNPRRCFHCGQPILEGDLWTKYTSPADPPEYGVYSLIVHQRCDRAGTASNVTTRARAPRAHTSTKG